MNRYKRNSGSLDILSRSIFWPWPLRQGRIRLWRTMLLLGGDYLEDLETLSEDEAIQRAIGRRDLPDPTTAGDVGNN